MNRSHIKLIILITVFSMSLAFIIGTIAMKRSSEYLTVEIEEKILNTAENFSNDFSSSFNHMEGLTDSLASNVLTTFDVNEFEIAPKRYMEEYKERLSNYIETNMYMASSAHSLYVTFNPQLTGTDEEVWYAVVDGKIKKIEADFKENKRDFQYPYAEDMVYYFEPQRKSLGVWTGPYYDKDIDEDVFSYSRAIYIDDLFIGVAGADINADDIVNIIKEMKAYPSGYSALIDEHNKFVVHHDGFASGEEEVIQKLLEKQTNEENETLGTIKYSFAGVNKILAYSKMDNRWTMIIVQPEEEAYGPITRLSEIFLILAFILGVSFVAFIVVLSRPFIKRQTSLEAENKEQEILLIYQSRQAKIGEMVGNITHQWKQPLNTIKLIMANLLDSYRYDKLDEERIEKSVDKVDNIIDKMAETITDFSEFLKPAKEKESFEMVACVNAALSLMQESLTYQRIKVDIVGGEDIYAYGYYNEAIHVVFNVLNNARDAIIEAGIEDKKIKIAIYNDGDYVVTEICNKGNNIPEDIMNQIFNPYFTTKESRGGTGLGLYISKQITEDRMDGNIVLENIEGGVLCKVSLPVEKR